jgi:hypothetical protein
MRIETALKRRDRAVTMQTSLIHSAELCGTPHADMHAERLKSLGYLCDKCPGWVRAYLDGHWHALIDDAYRHKLCFGGFDRVSRRFYSTHSNRADYYEKNGLDPCDYADDGRITERGHYWNRSIDEGKPRPFFVA